MSTAEPSLYPCPYCHENGLEAVATAPYVRGLLVAYLVGSKSFIGCTSCVRKKVLGEALLSLFIGWFSFVSLFLNPIFIVYNLIRGLFVGPNPAAIAKKLTALGLPEKPEVLDVNRVGYALAASMILADGKVEESELVAAEKAGDEVFGDFDEAALRMIVEHGTDLPPVEDLAAILRDQLDNDEKEKIMRYLTEIALADGHVAPEEKRMLEQVAVGLAFRSIGSE